MKDIQLLIDPTGIRAWESYAIKTLSSGTDPDDIEAFTVGKRSYPGQAR